MIIDPYDLEAPRPRRRSKIGYDPYDPEVNEDGLGIHPDDLAPEERQGLLDALGSAASTTTGYLFDAINAGSSRVMDTLAGKELGSGSTGVDALENMALLPNKDSIGGWARPLAGFALEATTDPLNLLTFGGGAITKGAAAAKAVTRAGEVGNLLGDAARAASRRAISNRTTLGRYGDNAAAAFDQNFGKGLDDLTDADLAARPLFGTREARRSQTLRELVDAQPAPSRPQLMSDLSDYFQVNGGSLAKELDSSLGADIGVRLPFHTTSLATANLPGGAAIARGLDRVSQAVRWSPVGRGAMATFAGSVRGKLDEGDQIMAKQSYASDLKADALSRAEATRIVDRAPEEMFTRAGGNAVRATVEGVANPAQRAVMAGSRGLQQFADDSRNILEDVRLRSEDIGIASEAYRDKWGTGYFPRAVTDENFVTPGVAREVHVPPNRGRDNSVMTADSLARKPAYRTPGGSNVLQELGLDPNVAGPQRLLSTDREASEYIKRRLDTEARRIYPTGRLPVSQQQIQQAAARGLPVPTRGLPARVNRAHTLEIARTLHQVSPRSISAGHPIFGRSPVEDLVSHLKGRERAIGRAGWIEDQIASVSRNQNFKDIPGGSHISLAAAMKQLKLRTKTVNGSVVGAKAQMLDRLAQRFPGIDMAGLADVSIDRRMLQRLAVIADSYDVPQFHHKVLQVLDDVTKMFKGSILAWPARFARDRMSGLFSNMLEVGSPGDLLAGYKTAKLLVQGQTDELARHLALAPRYERLPIGDRVAQYRADMSSTSLLTGRRLQDVGGELEELGTGAGIRDTLMPGHNPRTTLGYQAGDVLMGRKPVGGEHAAYSELFNAGNWRQALGKLGRPIQSMSDTDVTHPILRWSARQGDVTDTINRVAGYNALVLKQGLSPQAAAERIAAAQVDYGSLSKIEREWFRRLAPFYSFSSRISKYVAEQGFNDPGGRLFQFGVRLPNALSKGSEDDAYVPASIQQKYGFSLEPYRNPVIDMIAPQQPGVKSWLSDIDIPGIDQLNQVRIDRGLDGRINLGNSAWGSFQNIMAGNAHPLLKTGIEAISGQDLFTQRPKKDSLTSLQALGQRTGLTTENSTADSILQGIDPAVQMIPFAPRLLQLARRATDAEKVPSVTARVLQNALNMYSGFKVQNVSDESRRYDAMRKLDSLLSANPATKRMEQTYLPAGIAADPDTLQLYALRRQLMREAAAAKKKPTKKGKKRKSSDPYEAALHNPLY